MRGEIESMIKVSNSESMETSRLIWVLFLFLALFSISSCTNKMESNRLFEQVSSNHSNIDFVNFIPENELTNSFVYEYVYNGGGVSIGDINNDGLDDIYLTSNLDDNHLYLNKGNLEFENITETSKVKGKRGWTTGTTMVDINNDGLLDIYVCKSGPYGKASLLENELFINKGANEDGIPIFEEAAKTYGLNDTSHSVQSSFFDFDLDGDLDMFLMNHNPQTFSPKGDREVFSDLGDKFYVNEGGKYVNKTKEVGIYSNSISYGLGLGVSDLNMDGWPDVYVSNDYDERDYMYINQQNGTFKEVIKQTTNHISNFAMGNDIADFDNDGYVDILTLDMVSEDNYGMKTSMASMNPQKFAKNVEDGKHYQYMYNTLQKHSTHVDSMGVPFFSDVAQIAGISNTDWSWAPLMADFDNDGLKDIFISNGVKRDFRNKDFFKGMQEFRRLNPDALSNPKKIKSLIDRTPFRPQRNYFYQNNGGLKFENTSETWVENAAESFSNGAAYGDLDNDGDLDMVINNVDEKAQLLENHSDRNKLNFIQLNFKGLPKNNFGIGTKVLIYSEGFKQLYENNMTRGYQSSVSPKLHIGLGKTKKVDSLIVYWPQGERQKVLNIELNKLSTIVYNETKVTRNTKNNGPILFKSLDLGAQLKHYENDFDDYGKQLLLPHKLSQFGPAVAVGDMNSDGLDDIYLGQSSGTPSTMYKQLTNGQFKLHQTFLDDTVFEDVDAKFFDFDNDGDLDLYVSSGGNEFEPGSPNYRDRLYENRKGTFVKRMDLLPKDIRVSSSKIRVMDYDNDGFTDVFVGGRHMPHDYPTPQTSYILRNEHGKFININNESAPDLNNIGLVTDATWTDFDLDGDIDLCVVGEWMTPTFFENEDNTFKKVTSKTLDSLSGWYFSVKAFDIDADGDDDYILGNLGDNYKYKASFDEPFEVYYNDFDSNGSKDLVLGYYNFGELFPVRGRECSSQQMPNIKQITPTFDQFGKSTLIDIYGADKLKDALHLSSYNFKSGVLRNNGNGDFEFIKFPELAQISSINDIIVRDLNQDGMEDLIVAGNIFASEIETPRNDAGYGLILMNNKEGTFTALNSNKTGLFLPNDVKTLQTILIKGDVCILAGNNNDEIGVFGVIPN